MVVEFESVNFNREENCEILLEIYFFKSTLTLYDTV